MAMLLMFREELDKGTISGLRVERNTPANVDQCRSLSTRVLEQLFEEIWLRARVVIRMLRLVQRKQFRVSSVLNVTRDASLL